MFRRRKHSIRQWRVYTDGAIRPEQSISGLSAVVVDESGGIALWWYRSAGKLTCNEAEYAAALLALEQLMPFRPLEIDLYSDSQVMVRQMSGLAATRAAALKQMQARLRERVIAFERVTFHHIGREENRVADALANEAIIRRQKELGGKEIICAKNLSTVRPSSGQ